MEVENGPLEDHCPLQTVVVCRFRDYYNSSISHGVSQSGPSGLPRVRFTFVTSQPSHRWAVELLARNPSGTAGAATWSWQIWAPEPTVLPAAWSSGFGVGLGKVGGSASRRGRREGSLKRAQKEMKGASKSYVRMTATFLQFLWPYILERPAHMCGVGGVGPVVILTSPRPLSESCAPGKGWQHRNLN